MWIYLQRTRIGQITATARRIYCKWILLFKKKKKNYQPCLCLFILLRARYFAQAMTSCKDLLITKKIEMTFYSIIESISRLGKMARTSAKSENPNAPVVNRRVRGRSLPWITHTTKDLMKKRHYHHKKSIKTNKELHWSSYKNHISTWFLPSFV